MKNANITVIFNEKDNKFHENSWKFSIRSFRIRENMLHNWSFLGEITLRFSFEIQNRLEVPMYFYRKKHLFSREKHNK